MQRNSTVIIITAMALDWITKFLIPEIKNQMSEHTIANDEKHSDTEEGALADQPNGNLMAEKSNLLKLNDLVNGRLKVIKENNLPTDVACIGRRVTVVGVDFNYKARYYLSGCNIPGHRPYFKAKNIELTDPDSPMGAKLIGRKIGDVIELENRKKIKITEVESMQKTEEELFEIPVATTA